MKAPQRLAALNALGCSLQHWNTSKHLAYSIKLACRTERRFRLALQLIQPQSPLLLCCRNILFPPNSHLLPTPLTSRDEYNSKICSQFNRSAQKKFNSLSQNRKYVDRRALFFSRLFYRLTYSLHLKKILSFPFFDTFLRKLKLTFSFNITVCKNGRASFKGRKPILSTDCMTFTHLYF